MRDKLRICAAGLCCLLLCAACVKAPSTPQVSPTPQPRIALLRQPTLTPRLIDEPAHTPSPISAATDQPAYTSSPAPVLVATSAPTDTPSPISTATDAPAHALVALLATPTPPLPTALLLATWTPIVIDTPTPTGDPAPTVTIIGMSGGGRPLTAQRFGTGARVLLLVGGIHGGWEGNTVLLAQQLADYFAHNPQDVLPGISIVIVPVANPDGYARGRIWTGRFNVNGVDLNRNWACNWSPDAYWQQARVSPGAHPMSEPETQVLSAFITQLQPSAALFYHSSANGVFAGNCGGDHGSAAMSAVYGQATGYRYGSPFVAYPVTGTASDWLDGLGIPSADVELITSGDSEFARNLAGVLALERWLAR